MHPPMRLEVSTVEYVADRQFWRAWRIRPPHGSGRVSDGLTYSTSDPSRYPSGDDTQSDRDCGPVTRRTLTTETTGQHGSYPGELLLSKGYDAHRLIRRSSSFSTGRIDSRDPHQANLPLPLHYRDLTGSTSLINSLSRIKPDEVYNTGAQNHVKVSYDLPESTADTGETGALRLLEAIWHADRPTRYCRAGRSEMVAEPAGSGSAG